MASVFIQSSVTSIQRSTWFCHYWFYIVACCFPSRTLLKSQWQISEIIYPLSTLAADFANVWLKWLLSFAFSNDFWLQYLATNCTKWTWKWMASLSSTACLLMISVLKSLGQWVKLNFLSFHLVNRKKSRLENTVTFIQVCLVQY